MATALTLAAALITALAVADGRLTPGAIRAATSLPAIGVILAAVVLREPIAALGFGRWI